MLGSSELKRNEIYLRGYPLEEISGRVSYVEAIMTFIRALELERPVVMGCSMGGRIVLQLALEHAGELGGVIGLEAADHQTPWYDTEWLHRPDVHGGEVSAALVSGLVGALAPDEHRWETLWGYMQSGPGVFKGDLHFYRVDSDLRGKLDRIDTAALLAHSDLWCARRRLCAHACDDAAVYLYFPEFPP